MYVMCVTDAYSKIRGLGDRIVDGDQLMQMVYSDRWDVRLDVYIYRFIEKQYIDKCLRVYLLVYEYRYRENNVPIIQQ